MLQAAWRNVKNYFASFKFPAFFPQNNLLIVAFTAAAIVLLLLLTIAIFIFVSRRKKNHTQESDVQNCLKAKDIEACNQATSANPPLTGTVAAAFSNAIFSHSSVHLPVTEEDVVRCSRRASLPDLGSLVKCSSSASLCASNSASEDDPTPNKVCIRTKTENLVLDRTNPFLESVLEFLEQEERPPSARSAEEQPSIKKSTSSLYSHTFPDVFPPVAATRGNFYAKRQLTEDACDDSYQRKSFIATAAASSVTNVRCFDEADATEATGNAFGDPKLIRVFFFETTDAAHLQETFGENFSKDNPFIGTEARLTTEWNDD